MLSINIDTNQFMKEMTNIVDYSSGFVDGIKKGKTQFLKNIANGITSALNQYIDAVARMNREALHHVYEWYKEGSPEARLFEFEYQVTSGGLSLNGTFRQSTTVSANGTKPFYDKARIMEQGIPVTITPSGNGVLRFNAGGQEIFTKRPVTVNSPGGPEVQGYFEKTVQDFIKNYFRQSFLKASGLYDYLNNPFSYKANLGLGMKQGKNVGVSVGYKWITGARAGVENV